MALNHKQSVGDFKWIFSYILLLAYNNKLYWKSWKMNSLKCICHLIPVGIFNGWRCCALMSCWKGGGHGGVWFMNDDNDNSKRISIIRHVVKGPPNERFVCASVYVWWWCVSVLVCGLCWYRFDLYKIVKVRLKREKWKTLRENQLLSIQEYTISVLNFWKIIEFAKSRGLLASNMFQRWKIEMLSGIEL